MKKDQEFRELVQSEMPRGPLSPRAEKRFQETYQRLGPQKESVKKRRSRRAWIISVASAAACFTLLFATNAAFPAFAESLPVVGRFFQTLNDSFSSYNHLAKHPAGTYVGTYGVQDLGQQAAEDHGFRLSAGQAYCDGKLITFSMTLETPEDMMDRFDFLSYPDLSATVDGKNSSITSAIGLYPTEDGIFTGSMVLALPEFAQNGQVLDVAVSIPILEGKDKTTKDDKIPLNASFTLSFQVQADTSHNREFTLESEEFNGAKVLGFETTPIYTKVTVRKPCWDTPESDLTAGLPALYLQDGTRIAFNAAGSSEAGYDDNAVETQTASLLFDGVPAGTETVVFRLYQDNRFTEVLAEFTLDLANGTAVPSKTYAQGGALDLNAPYRYNSILWTDSYPLSSDKPEFTNGFSLIRTEYSTYRSELYLTIVTDGEYRELTAEAYNADGALIGSTVSSYGTKYENENWYWDENSPFFDEQAAYYPYHSYALYLKPEEGYQPAWKESVTIKLTDQKTGETILAQEIPLEQRVLN